MDGADWLTYVIAKFKRPDKNPEILEATTDIIADMRIQFYPDMFKEEAYLSGITVLGEYRLPLPVDFGHLIGDISITDPNNDTWFPPLLKLSKEAYDQLYPERLLTGSSQLRQVPIHYCIYADQIYLGPVPNSMEYRYQINYTTEAGQIISESTDPVPFSNKAPHRNVLRAGVLKELHDGMENYDEAAYWEGEYNKGLSKIIASETNYVQDNESVEYSGC